MREEPRLARVRLKESDADLATQDDSSQREVSAPGSADRPRGVMKADVEAAVRAAAKVAIDAGDVARAKALLHLLDSTAVAPSLVPPA